LRGRKGPFTDTTIDRLIRDSTAKGQYRSNFTKLVGGSKGWIFKPEHEWVVTPVEPIVSEELWEQCNALLESRLVRRARPGPRPVHTFTGFVFCACGQKMYVPSHTPKYLCTACRTKIPVVDLDNIFHEELKGYLLDPVKVTDYLKRGSETLADREKLLDTLRSEQRRLKDEVESTFKLYHSGGLTVEQFKARFQPLEDRQQQLAAELPRVDGELAFLKIEGLSTEHIMAEARDFYARWPKMVPDEKRRIVEALVKTIVVAKDQITINLCYSPSFENMAERQRIVTDKEGLATKRHKGRGAPVGVSARL